MRDDGRRARLASWALVWAAAIGLTVVSTRQSLGRYRDFASGWAWDLAYNNQMFWALVKGDQTLSIRPVNAYGDEGPSIWTRTHLDPIRLPMVPIYALDPGPEILLVLHNIILWWALPAAFGLALAEGRSARLALLAAALVPTTPVLWILLWNDFRETELALPFILWAVQGYRGRNLGLTVGGVAGMIACREEFALVAASLALLPPRAPEPIGRTLRWARGVVGPGVAWMVLAFFGFLQWKIGHASPANYMSQFGGGRPPLGVIVGTSAELWVGGLGAWALFALLSPRAAALSLPWLWSMATGKWALRLLAGPLWHHVRYMTLMVALGLAAGLLGWARFGVWALARRGGWAIVLFAWVAALAGNLATKRQVDALFARNPPILSRAEAAAVRRWVGAVGPEDGVIAHYDLTAPLSSRRHLYSYQMDQHRPRGYPALGPSIRWIFALRRGGEFDPGVFRPQGFAVVHEGPGVWILRRAPTKSPPG